MIQGCGSKGTSYEEGMGRTDGGMASFGCFDYMLTGTFAHTAPDMCDTDLAEL